MTDEKLQRLLAAPALQAPDGITPQFDNPPNRNDLAWAVIIFCTVVSALSFLLRVYGRIWLDQKLGIDDVMLIAAFLAYLASAYAVYSLVWTPGYYVHTWDLLMGDLVRPLWLILVYGSCYSAILPCLKSAILLDWCRFFVPGHKYKSPFWWGCIIIIVVQCTWGVVCITLFNLQCRPHDAIWKFWLPKKCYELWKVMLVSSGIQIFSDVAMILLPQPIIWGLNMDWRRKVGTSFIFSAGIIAFVAACFRFAQTIAFSEVTDGAWFIAPLIFWSFGEMTCWFFVLSATCIPKVVAESRRRWTVNTVAEIITQPFSTTDNNNLNSMHMSDRLVEPNQFSDSHRQLKDSIFPMTGINMPDSQESLQG